eukprot:TRINITY_DN2258_c0_g2_i1.p1 TRINITY_DN2258_c0_g2~~TRINITY_DN2258_c0_g2_i1.p1  ORF type:complete len:794 (-),score=190.55 TRINITY_DN2258_c0_g2_i1:97-2478(-)
MEDPQTNDTSSVNSNDSNSSKNVLEKNHPHFATSPNLISEGGILSSSQPSSPLLTRPSEDFKFIGDTRKRAPSKGGLRSISPSKSFFKTVRRTMTSDEVAPPLNKPILDRSKSEAVIRKFNLNPAEVLVDDFSAALLKQILLHGRLYLTQNYLCFESKIFGSKTAEVIPLNEIVVLKKKSRKLKLHVGIEISTASHTYHFASFVSRDKAFNIIHEAWGKSAPEKAQAQVHADSSGGDEWDEEENEVTTSQNDSYLSASEDDVSISDRRGSFNLENEAAFSDASEHANHNHISASEGINRKLSDPSRNEKEPRSNGPTPQTSPNFKPQHYRSASSPIHASSFAMSSMPSISSNGANNNGNHNNHNNNANDTNVISQEQQRETTNTDLQTNNNNNTTNTIPVENSNNSGNNNNNNNNLLLSQTTIVNPPPQNNPVDDLIFDEQNYSDASGFLGSSQLQMILSENFDLSVTDFFKIFFSDKSTFTSRYHVQRGDQDFSVKKWAKNQQFGTMREILYSAKVNAPLGPDRTRVQEAQKCHLQKERLIIETVGTMCDVPYGDCFKVEGKWEISSAGGNSCRLVINIAVNFVKKTWFKGKIESQTIKETTESFKTWISMAKVEAQNPEVLKSLLQVQTQTTTTATNTQQTEIPRNLSSNSLASSGPDVPSPSLMRRNPSWNSLQNQNAQSSSSAKPRRKKSTSSNLPDSSSQIPVVQTTSIIPQSQNASTLAFPPPANLPSKSIISRINDIISASEQLDLKTIFIIVLFFVCMNLYMRLQYIEGKLDLLESLVKMNLQKN